MKETVKNTLRSDLLLQDTVAPSTGSRSEMLSVGAATAKTLLKPSNFLVQRQSNNMEEQAFNTRSCGCRSTTTVGGRRRRNKNIWSNIVLLERCQSRNSWTTNTKNKDTGPCWTKGFSLLLLSTLCVLKTSLTEDFWFELFCSLCCEWTKKKRHYWKIRLAVWSVWRHPAWAPFHLWWQGGKQKREDAALSVYSPVPLLEPTPLCTSHTPSHSHSLTPTHYYFFFLNKLLSFERFFSPFSVESCGEVLCNLYSLPMLRPSESREVIDGLRPTLGSMLAGSWPKL